jgi:hypothetical protein
VTVAAAAPFSTAEDVAEVHPLKLSNFDVRGLPSLNTQRSHNHHYDFRLSISDPANKAAVGNSSTKAIFTTAETMITIYNGKCASAIKFIGIRPNALPTNITLK